MVTYHMCLLLLWLTASSTYGVPTITVPDDAHHDHHIPPTDQQPLPSSSPKPQQQPTLEPHHPPLRAAMDRAAQPLLPRDTGIDIPCSDDSNCTSSVMGEYSECHGSTCHCKHGALLSPESKRCLKESVLGGGCAEEWQCSRPLGNTVSCQNNICTCKKEAILINGKCWNQKFIDDQCTSAEECLKGQNTECVQNRCVCKTSTVPSASRDKCLSNAVKPSDPCEEDIQCSEPFGSGAACVNGKCICQDSYHFKNHICMKNLKIGAPCGTGYEGDCFLIHDQGINHVECVGNKCLCRDDRTPSADGERCLSPDQKDQGSGGGAESIQPLLLTLATMLFARFLLS